MRLALVGLVGFLGARAEAAVVSGRVLADVDGDHQVSAADRPIDGAVVVWEDLVFTRTDAAGGFTLEAPEAGVVWVRPPEGFSPAQVWREVPAEGATGVDLLLTPWVAPRPLRFVHFSDSHVGVVQGDALRRALLQAVGTEPHPAFVLGTGDLTQSSQVGEFEAVLAATSALPVPFVAVMGNHDFYDAGVAYRRFLGSPAYSFDAGGAHFVILDGQRPVGRQLAFLGADLARVAPGTPILSFGHYPFTLPNDRQLVDGFLAGGVRHHFTGHYHALRTYDVGGIVEHSIQPIAMGGMQPIPAGYAIVTVDGADPGVELRFVTRDPVVEVVFPRPGPCVAAGTVPVIVAVEQGPGAREITARLDGEAAVSLTPLAGWGATAPLTLLPGPHRLQVDVRQGDATTTRDVELCAAAREPVTPTTSWTQLGGSPRHEHAVPFSVEPPLRPLWATAVGGYLVRGGPILAGGRLFVPVVDDGSGTAGGLVALDARTGAILWEVRDRSSVMNLPAWHDGLVIAAHVDGWVRAYDAATGAPRWARDLGEGVSPSGRELHAAPVVEGDLVYIGHMYRFVALDAATGDVRWEATPSVAPFNNLTISSVAVSQGLVLGTFGFGGEGLLAWSAADGAPRWQLMDSLTRAASGAPAIAGGRAYLATTDGHLARIELAEGRVAGFEPLLLGGHEYAFWTRSGPAVGAGHAYQPTQRDFLFASAIEDGEDDWYHRAEPGVLRTVHYQTEARSFSATPVLTGTTLWVGGDDGRLTALGAGHGEVRWSTDLGVPILAPVVPAEPGVLYVATFDGTVQALAHDPDARQGGGGCAVGPPGNSAPPLWFLVLLTPFFRRRKD